MEYIRATVWVGPVLYRVYCHHGARISLVELVDFFSEDETHKTTINAFEEDFSSAMPLITSVEAVDEFDLDDPLKIVMIDETGIYFW